jgi:ketosteroid isomerase-like protein
VEVAASNLEVVRELYDRFRPGDVTSAIELLSEDFVGEVPPSMSAEPDVYEGHEGALRYMRGFEGLMEDVRFEPLEMFEHGERVIVVVRLVGRGATSGIEVDQHVVVLHELENGKVKRMDAYPDLDAARDAAGAPEGESAS